MQSGQTTRITLDSDDTASSRLHQPGYSSIAVAQTWSPGNLRSLASDVASTMLNDPTLDRLDITEGGVSPWKGRAGADGANFEGTILYNSLDAGQEPVSKGPKQKTKAKPGMFPECDQV